MNPSTMSHSPSVIHHPSVVQLDWNSVRSNGTGTTTPNYTLVDLQRLSNKKAVTLIPAMVIIAGLIIVGIVGNLLVLFIFYTRLKANTQHFFILCLAVIDLVSCTVAMPAEIADMIHFYTFSSLLACKLLRFINSMSTFSSVFTLILIAIDRFRKICRPYGLQMTPSYARMALVLVLAFALLCSWPAPIIYGIAHVDVGYSPIMGQDCTVSDGVRDTVIPLVFNFLLLFGFIVLTVIIVVLYSLILIGLKRHNRTMRSLQLHEITRSQVKPKKRLSRLSHKQPIQPQAVIKSSGSGRESKQKTRFNKHIGKPSSYDNVVETHSACCTSDQSFDSCTFYNDNKQSVSSSEALDRNNDKESAYQDDQSISVSLHEKELSNQFSTSSVCMIDESGNTATSNLTVSPIHDSCASIEAVSQSELNSYSCSTIDTVSLSEMNSYSCVSIDALSLSEFNRYCCHKELHSQPKTRPLELKLRKTRTHETTSSKTRTHETTSSKTRTHETTSPKVSSASRRVNLTSKTTTIAFLVTLVFILSYLPHIILQVVKFAHELRGQEGVELVVFNLIVRSYFINSVANPIIYGVFNIQFRQEVCVLVRRIFSCTRS